VDSWLPRRFSPDECTRYAAASSNDETSQASPRFLQRVHLNGANRQQEIMHEPNQKSTQLGPGQLAV
jgi:hypothetical protein